MIELGQLEAARSEFERRNARVVVVSVEGQEEARLTQADFPHLVVVADEGRGLSEAIDVIHKGSNPHGGDTAAPTTIVLDGDGAVTWIHRPGNVVGRLTPAQLLAAIDD